MRMNQINLFTTNQQDGVQKHTAKKKGNLEPKARRVAQIRQHSTAITQTLPFRWIIFKSANLDTVNRLSFFATWEIGCLHNHPPTHCF
jgi:hypothetical protein